MYDVFGEFDSAADINDTAVNLRKEGDIESIKILAKENGIDQDIAEIFIEGELLFICDEMTAAIGKIEAESNDLKPVEIMEDWVNYLKARCFEDIEMAKAVRREGKSLKGCIGKLLAWSFKNQNPVDKDIIKAAGIKAGKVTLGIPGIGMAKKIMTEYYLEK